jgi:hypothetical protein
VPSTTIVVSFSAHPLSTVFQYKFIMLFTFFDLFHKVHSHHIFTFMSLPQFWPVQLFLQTGGNRVLHSITSTNRFMIFCIIPMPSISNAMINIECHKSFRWEINFGCTCIKKSLQDPIRSFFHSTMELIPSPRLWVTMSLSSTFPPSFACTQCLMWTSFDHTFHHYWTPQR